MKPRLPWHKTTVGRIACYLGSIKPAIPILFALAAALAVGTYIESTQSAKMAKHLVYGSWWFKLILVYTALALIFAVVVRYPWSRKHTGFIIVHTGIVTIIVGAFISFYTRVEGTITLQEGMASSTIDTDGRQLELLEAPTTMQNIVVAGQFDIPDHFSPDSDKTFNADDLNVHLVEEWDNATSHQIILNDAARPLEAIEYTTNPTARTGEWLGETRQDDPRSKIAGIQLRILPVNTTWEPAPNTQEGSESTEQAKVTDSVAAPAPAADRIYMEMADGTTIDLEQSEQAINSDWKVKELRVFRHATVGKDGLVEGDHGVDNPAIQVIIENVNDGTLERNISFAKYPDMKIARAIKGSTPSGFTLHYEHTAGPEDAVGGASDDNHDTNRLVFQNNLGKFKATWVRQDGTVKVFELTGDPPFALDLDGTKLFVLKHYTHARSGETFTRARKGKANLPVLIVEIEEGYKKSQLQIAWKSLTPYVREGQARPVFFRFGPKQHPVPFTLKLLDFRKLDYPGSEMAMAFESDVLWEPGHSKSASPMGSPALDEKVAKKQKIWMNNPLKYDGWKVYQAGFMGNNVSTFSVMRDPGLWPTYIGCILLCSGILVIFYLTDYSHGHPGIAKHANKRVSSHIDEDMNSTSNTGSSRTRKKGVAA